MPQSTQETPAGDTLPENDTMPAVPAGTLPKNDIMAAGDKMPQNDIVPPGDHIAEKNVMAAWGTPAVGAVPQSTAKQPAKPVRGRVGRMTAKKRNEAQTAALDALAQGASQAQAAAAAAVSPSTVWNWKRTDAHFAARYDTATNKAAAPEAAHPAQTAFMGQYGAAAEAENSTGSLQHTDPHRVLAHMMPALDITAQAVAAAKAVLRQASAAALLPAAAGGTAQGCCDCCICDCTACNPLDCTEEPYAQPEPAVSGTELLAQLAQAQGDTI